jgi:hypothetical protein
MDVAAEAMGVRRFGGPDRGGVAVLSAELALGTRHSGRWTSALVLASRVEAGDLDVSPYRDEKSTYDRSSRVRTPNALQTFLTWRGDGLSFSIGRQSVAWGPGQRGQLLLSEHSGPKPMVVWRYRLGKVALESLVAVLDGPREGPFRSPKYLAGHRLEASISDWLTLSAAETSVIGDRFDPKLLNPVDVFYLDASATSPDNRNIGLAASSFLPHRVEVYGELYIDDFQPQKGVDALRAVATKGGVLAGLLWADPAGIPDLDISLEYAFLNEFAYTHRRPVTEYTDRGAVLGHPIGTDAESVWARAVYYWTPTLRAIAEWERQRHGSGDVTKPLDSPPPPGAWDYLSGVVETTRAWTVGAELGGRDVAPGLWSRIGLTWVRQRNVGNALGVRRSYVDLRVAVGHRL